MKRLKNLTALAFTAIFCVCSTFGIQAQDLGEVDGTFGIKMNSTTGIPHIRLIEDDASDFGSTRLSMRHQANSNDYFELRAFLALGSGNQRVGWHFNGSPRVVYSETRNGLGIGTISPDEKLHVQVTGFDGIKIEGDGTGDARVWINNGAGSHFLFDDVSDANALGISSANAFILKTDGGERYRILETGEFLVNTPTFATGRQMSIESNSNLYAIEAYCANATSAVGIQGRVPGDGSSSRFGVLGRVDGTSGTNVRYGVYGSAATAPANSWALYSNGDHWFGGSLKMPSDQSLKKDIQQIEPVLDKVMQIDVKTYEYDHEKNTHLNLAHGKQYGFISQNIQTVFPTLVSETQHAGHDSLNPETGMIEGETTDILALKPLELIPILTKAIQEQQVMIDEMRDQIDALSTSK